MNKKQGLIDVLHELISQETKEAQPLFAKSHNYKRSPTKESEKAKLLLMRKIAKRDAFYRVIHIIRGYDLEFPRETISNDLRGEKNK